MAITRFRDEYFFLSNFYPHELYFHGMTFHNSEAAFQAMKTQDIAEQLQFTLLTPQEAKRLGRRINLRPDWEQVKDGIMKAVLRAKFSDLELRNRLLATGDVELVEGNTHGDTYWGVCNGVGRNRLGRLLMELREEYREPKYRLFVDMDGTAVEWKAAEEFEDLYEKGYFSSLKPYQNVVDAIRLIFQRTAVVEIYTLSAVLPDSPYSIPEKMEWLDQHMPFIPHDHRLFIHNGTEKIAAVPGGVRPSDVLLDDYTLNLNQWAKQAKAIKLLNGINGTKGTWKGAAVSRFCPADEIANAVLREFEMGEG